MPHTFRYSQRTGLQLRRYDSSFASLLIPHAEQPSEFYNKTLDTFRKPTASSAVVEPQDFEPRLVYRKLQATEFAPPVVIDKFPHVDFYKAFTNLNSHLIHPRARELEWRVLHRVVPVNEYLFRLHINRNALCPFCRWPECRRNYGTDFLVVGM